jgi:methanogenic corrinoid protein MtbC1
MVETEIIPRLMLAHRDSAPVTPTPRPDPRLGADATEAFAQMVVTREPDSLIAFVAGLLDSGVSLDTIYADLLAPAAKRLGEYWEDDRVSFTDVTVGLGRLQQLVRALGWRAESGDNLASLPRSVLFATVPGEQHVFGLFLLEDYFRRAGWRTWVETSATCEALVDSARGHWFDVFGLSASCEVKPGDLSRLVRAIRVASRNPNIFIMVGGRLFLDQPDMVSAVGADGTALSGGDALLIANHALLTADNQVSALAAGM